MFIKCYDLNNLRYGNRLCAEWLKVKGLPILLAFFSMFMVASLLIPYPMFPGNVLCQLIGESISEYARYVSAVFNGVFYGVILWLTFLGIGRRFEEEKH
jgi:pilus assembly protein TadC